MTKQFCDECGEQITQERPVLSRKRWLTLGKWSIRVEVSLSNPDDDEDEEYEEEDASPRSSDLCVPCLTKLLNQRALRINKR
jgi:hypothetical protein